MFFKDGATADDHFSNQSNISWLDILKESGIAISLFSILPVLVSIHEARRLTQCLLVLLLIANDSYHRHLHESIL